MIVIIHFKFGIRIDLVKTYKTRFDDLLQYEAIVSGKEKSTISDPVIWVKTVLFIYVLTNCNFSQHVFLLSDFRICL